MPNNGKTETNTPVAGAALVGEEAAVDDEESAMNA